MPDQDETNEGVRAESVNPTLVANVVTAVQSLFPIEGDNGKVRIEASDVKVESSKFDPHALNKWQSARQNGTSVTVPITADLTLIRDGKVAQRVSRFKLGDMPLMGALGTFQVKGADYFTPMQLRLKPGVYTQEKVNGEIQSFIPTKGAQLKLHMDQATGIIKLEVYSTNVSWYALVRALGATDQDILSAWGDDKPARELLEKNKVKNPDKDVEKFFKTIIVGKQNRDLVRAGLEKTDETFRDVDKAGQVTAIESWMRDHRLDPGVTKKNLGTAFDSLSASVLVQASRRILEVSRGTGEPDDRDALAHKTIHGVDDLLPERITRLGRRLTRKLLQKLGKPDATIAKGFGSAWLNPATVGYFGGARDIEGGLSHTAEAANPLAMLSENSKVTLGGEGGISTTRAITTEARLFRPSAANFIDLTHTPEGSEIGVTTHTAWNTRKVGNTLEAMFLKCENGVAKEPVWISAEKADESIIAYPEYFDIGGTGKAKEKLVRANKHGNIELVPVSEVQYVIPSGRSMFDHTSNAALFFDNTSANRGMMAGKHLTQALPLIHREHPLVTMVDGKGNSVLEALAKTFTIRSRVDGTVTKVTPTQIVVGDTVHEILNEYAVQAKVALNQFAVVKVGDKVKKGDLLADSNYSRDGKLTLGVNVRTAYMPWKNASNYEDAIVISDSAAKKFTSEHVHREELELVPGIVVDKKLTQAQFPTIFTAKSFDLIDGTGVVKEGSKVEPGQVLIAAVKKVEFDPQDRSVKNLASIHKILERPYKNVCVVWNEIFTGTVYRVVRTSTSITVHLKTEEPMQVGDKLSMSSAAKGTVSSIIPDDKMPRTKKNEHIEVILSPHGVVGRINPSQTIEQAASKWVKETGKPYVFSNFDGTNRAKDIADKLAKAGISHEEKLFDPETGKWLERPVGVGYNYMVKLDHPVRKRFSARERDSYTMDETPTRGKGVGAQPYDHLTTYALLGHNAHAILGESAGIRGTKNSEYWDAYQAGELPPPPKVPFIFEKFRAYLNAAGVDTQKNGNVLQYLPMSEKRVLAQSNGEITNATMVRSKDLAEEKNGLYDVGITGGLKGQNWGHIALNERIPHPLYEKTLCDILGMKRSDFYGMIGHKVYWNAATGKFQNEASHGAVTGEEGFKKLLSFDIDDKLAEVKRGLRTAVGSDANKLNRAARYLNGLKSTKLTPFDAYMTKVIPVIPPMYRPIIELSGGALRVADSNTLYRDVILTNNALKEGKTANMPSDAQSDARIAVYRSVGALAGVNSALTHRDDREDAQGFLDIIKGKTNKTGLFQRLVTSHRNDYSGRSTIEPDANLGVDEIGIPEEMAWKIYKPMLVRRLSLLGTKPKDALEAVEKRTLIARQALAEEMKNRPVLINRAPSLHRWSISAAFPRISSGKEVRISPLITGPTNSDFDGDAVSITPSITDSALKESLKLLPSRNLIYDKDRALAYGVSKDIISGIFALTKPGSPSGKKYATAEAAIQAYHDNKDSLQMGSLVSIAGAAPVAVGWLIFQKLVPARFLGSMGPPIDGKKLDKLLTDIANKSPTDFNVISRSLTQAGFQFAAAAGGITTTIGELNIDRTKVNRLLDQMERNIDKAVGAKAKREAATKGYNDVNPQLEELVKDHLKDVDRGYHSFLESGSNKKLDQMKQMLVSPVLMSNVRDEVVPAVIKTSYGSGMSPSDYMLTTPGSRKGLVARSLTTALPGALAKEAAANMSSVRIYDKDCGTTRGIQEPLKPPAGIKDPDVDLIDRHLLRDIPGTLFKRNDPVTPQMLSRLRDADIQSIWIRSPMTCQAPSPPCQMCAGRAANGELWPIGSNIGYNYGQAVSERSTQLVLRQFHAGGTIGAGESLMAGFDRLKELLSVPDVIKKQGTLSTVTGTVTNTKLAPQGGYYVTVGDTEHHIQQGRDLIVKNGDTVSAGDPLSTGNFKPQEIATHKGLLAAQQYVVNQIRKSYQDAGAVVRKPVIEVLAAGLMRTVEITDDGGEPDLAIGDIIHENDYEMRKKRNPKIKAKPMLLGLSQKPLQSQDLLERLNFQRLDDAVRDVASSGGKSDLTGSKSPIPGLAYGAAFRPEADSGFNQLVRNQ